MPPPSMKKPLTKAQNAILKQWVADGAEFRNLWSFIAPKQAALPKVKQKDWPKNPIDYFVLARLEAAGLKPSPPADKYTLVRRVYLDLIGLPPTPEEADAFVNDKSPDAYEKLVDRLLRSPHYGERWARRWLDLARYADTNGYEKDRAADHVALSRLGHQRAQRRFAVRPVHDPATRRRPAAECHAGQMNCDRISSQHDAERRRRGRSARVSLARRQRSRRHDRHNLAWPDASMLPVPQSQVRPDHAEGVLPALRVPQQLRRADDRCAVGEDRCRAGVR